MRNTVSPKLLIEQRIIAYGKTWTLMTQCRSHSGVFRLSVESRLKNTLTNLLGGKESTCQAGDPGLIPGSGRSPGGGHGNLLQYSCLENLQGQRSLAGYSSWHLKESDMAEWLSTAHRKTCNVMKTWLSSTSTEAHTKEKWQRHSTWNWCAKGRQTYQLFSISHPLYHCSLACWLVFYYTTVHQKRKQRRANNRKQPPQTNTYGFRSKI